mmetsp:Transcript_73452/g.157385  ORF Transcript_73452/g.157385 Transcript_73452/m.157385 type:complete len:323 (-) Transcript_73452:1625-2593(-)
MEASEASQDGGPEAAVCDGEVQAQGRDDLHHQRVRLVRPPKGTRQAVFAALVEALEVLRHAQALEGIHVKIKLPDLAEVFNGIPVGLRDLIQGRDSEEHGERPALGVVWHASVLCKHHAQEKDATSSNVLANVLGYLASAAGMPWLRNQHNSLQAHQARRILREQVSASDFFGRKRGTDTFDASTCDTLTQQCLVTCLRLFQLHGSICRHPSWISQPLFYQLMSDFLGRQFMPTANAINQLVHALHMWCPSCCSKLHGTAIALCRMITRCAVLLMRPQYRRHVEVEGGDAGLGSSQDHKLIESTETCAFQIPTRFQQAHLLL